MESLSTKSSIGNGGSSTSSTCTPSYRHAFFFPEFHLSCDAVISAIQIKKC